MLLGKRIKEQRKKLKLTQEELGKLVNVTKVSICCYENGTRTPTLETLKVLAEAFNVDINYLLGNDSFEIAEKNSDYGIHMSKEEISFIKEIRKYENLYCLMIDDPKRFVELINRKIK
ncbi:MAG: helix-turn-helix transcriptional regulator [Bacilli bacterium]|nr:helix-turn-helix transcriptional regulator [Bacilli bacterium]